MHRTLTLLALAGLVVACGSGQGNGLPRTDDQSPPLNGDGPPNYTDTAAANDQAPLNDSEQPTPNDQAPVGGTIAGGVCAGTTTPTEVMNIFMRVSCTKGYACPAGAEGFNYWMEFCDYMTNCVVSPEQCDFSLDESIPVCAAGVESCLTAAVDYLGCDVNGDQFENLDLSEVPECAGIAAFQSNTEQSPPPDQITDDFGAGGGGG